MVSYWCPKMECYVYIGQMVVDESIKADLDLEESK